MIGIEDLTGTESHAFQTLGAAVVSRLVETRDKGCFVDWNPSPAEIVEALKEQITELESAMRNQQPTTVVRKCSDLVVWVMKANQKYGTK